MDNVINIIPFLAQKEAELAFQWAVDIRETINGMRNGQIYRPPAKKVYDLHNGPKEMAARLSDLAIAMREHGLPAHADIVWDLSDSLLEGPDAA